MLLVVAQHLLVVGDQPARTRREGLRAIEDGAFEESHVLSDPASDLVLPAATKARRPHDRDCTGGFLGSAQGHGGQDRLDRLAQTHLVGEESTTGSRQELGTGPLIRVGRQAQLWEELPKRTGG